VPDVAPSAEQVRAALDELLGWQGISRSPQLAELLRYVVEKTLAGDDASIKAYTIAVDVLGRPQSFDPQADPIVRVQARRLRMLLEQFYDSGQANSDVRIRMPIGRYVPEFAFVGGRAPDVARAPSSMPEIRAVRPGLNRFLLNALLGLCLTFIGVALAVAMVRWIQPQGGSSATRPLPDFPQVTIGAFDNLTGEPTLDDDVAAIAERLSTALGRFELLRLGSDGAQFTVRGSVQQSGGQFSVKALVSQRGSDGIFWSTTLSPKAGTTDTEALTNASMMLASQLGLPTGPLHAPDLAWLSQQPAAPKRINLYICLLEYVAWRDGRNLPQAVDALDCLQQVLAASPDDALALAADAGLRSWRKQYDGTPGADQVALLTDEATEAGRAVALMPTSSFVYEQQGLVLARQGLFDAAVGALRKAVELNPASTDARAAYGLLLWASGAIDEGREIAESALAGIASPPPWYYMTRAFDALRQRRFYDAIDAAQALAAGEGELGPAIALAAAPIVGRLDLVDRYRPLVMDNPYFQESGILPRLQQLYNVPVVLERIREGLVLAGVPPAAIDKPFNPDGTPRQSA
jgi:tetratricopeptide (TPR) repeat protein